MQVPRSLLNLVSPRPSTSAVLVLKCFGASLGSLREWPLLQPVLIIAAKRSDFI